MLTHKGTAQLETPRLILRKARRTDARAMYDNWASDPQVTKFLTWSVHSSPEVSLAVIDSWIQNYSQMDYYQWMIVPRDPGAGPIGSISVVSQNDRTEQAEIGYCIGKAWWHQGIMSEALQAVIDFLFREVGMNRIDAKHDPNNPHSGSVMKKCGMRYEGTSRQSCWNNQGICDAACYVIFKNQYFSQGHFMGDYSSESDDALVQELYRRFDEDGRLNRSKAARVEFYTTVRCIRQYLAPGAKILDVGAGAGEYSLYFARQGYSVSALELSERNLSVFQEKISDGTPVALSAGNARDLSRYPDDHFDIVLLLGPLYHVHDLEGKLKCIQEAQRVCKPGGKLFLGFISNDIVILTMQQEDPTYLMRGAYDKETFRLKDFPFVFHTLEECRELLRLAGVRPIREVASDGASELLQQQINIMDDDTYQQYLRYHFYICEKPEFLGMSNHLLIICEKQV